MLKRDHLEDLGIDGKIIATSLRVGR